MRALFADIRGLRCLLAGISTVAKLSPHRRHEHGSNLLPLIPGFRLRLPFIDRSTGSDGAPGPQDPQGSQGNDGPQGASGPQGPQGPQGAPFASAAVDTVSTLNPGEPATVGTGFDGSNVHFTFGIPRGAPGVDGTDGPQGLPGEVTNAALASAIAGTSASTNAVSTLDTPFTNDPPTLADMEVLRAKLNEMLLAMRR